MWGVAAEVNEGSQIPFGKLKTKWINSFEIVPRIKQVVDIQYKSDEYFWQLRAN